MRYEWLIFVMGCMLGLLGLFLAMRANRKKRLVDDIPTAKTTGVFIGLVELQGTAESESPLTSFLAEQRCVHFDYSVQEHWSRTVTESYTDSDGKRKTRTRRESGWKTVDQGGLSSPFYLQDDHGVVLVRPDGAKIEPGTMFDEKCGRGDPLYYGKGPAMAVSDSDHRRRFVERGLPLHQQLYVMGQARERKDIVAPEIAYDKEAPMFLISTKSEQAVSRGLWWAFFGWALFGFLICVAGFLIFDIVLKAPVASRIWVYVCAAAGYAFALVLGWIWMVYNSLIGLRARTRQAWSLVDIQLKRRHDLIPNLVRVVSGLKEHEREVQTEVAELRNQVESANEADTGAHAVGQRLIAVIEAYPELKANDAFMNLHKNLIDTEQRIALARGYYNDIATFYNTRLEIVPDCFLAKLGKLEPSGLMLAAGFERAPVKVDLQT